MTDQVARMSMASSWIEQLEAAPRDDDPFLVRGPDGQIIVIENHQRRAISAGLLAAALAQTLGAPRNMTQQELDHFDESVPVEILEAPRGKPFVVIGGRRMPVRGMPLPHPVSNDEAEPFTDGPEVNIAAANVPRSEFEDALTGKYQVNAARESISRKGVVPAVTGWGRRAWGRLRSVVSN